jgi:hypothetical protein
MSNAAFDLFEDICVELSGQQESFLVDDDYSPLTLQNLKQWAKEPATTTAVAKAIDYLNKHFASKGASLPFGYDPTTARFTALDPKYIDFVDLMRNIRSNPHMSSEFERKVTERLALRTTGVLHRVGWKRTKDKEVKKFNRYLQKNLGFTQKVLLGKEKDGGLDILWAPPIGSFPHRPLVSVQCKNGEYDRAVADASLGTSKSSLDRQDGLLPEVHLYCVLFNDYITPNILPEKRVGFVPLGISDLAAPLKPIESHVL